jgi:hypothetical protein
MLPLPAVMSRREAVGNAFALIAAFSLRFASFEMTS